MLVARGLTKRLDGRPVLRGVDLRVGAGEVVGLLGNNGAGKSTLLRILAGWLEPDAGTCLIEGREHPVRVQRGLVGLCGANERSFYGRLSGRENLRFFGALHGLRGGAAEARIDELGATLRIGGFLERLVGTYSSGMLQRLNVARAALHGPRVLLLDEPTKAADPATADDLRTLFRAHWARSGTAVLVVTHDVFDLERLCDRLLVLDAGRVAIEGTPAELAERGHADLRATLRALRGAEAA